MVFERGISLRTPKMSISHSPDLILQQFEDNAMWHLQVLQNNSNIYQVLLTNTFFISFQSIIDADDFQVVLSSTKLLCESVNDFLNRVAETYREDEQLNIKCDILR